MMKVFILLRKICSHMKANVLFTIFILASSFCSCGKYENPDLGEFEAIKNGIDMTQNNKYDESRFCKDWVLSKVLYETYVDGVLEKTEDHTDYWGKMEYSLRNDHTMTYWGSKGIWLYSHNCLLMKHDGSYYSYEVVKVTSDALHLKEEDVPVGGPYTLFFKDKNGKHCFNVFEYKAQ